MNPAQAISLYAAHNPYDSALARANSSYTAYIEGELVRLLDWREPSARTRMVHDTLRRFIEDPAYPCLGAKSALGRNTYRFGLYGPIGSPEATAGLARDLCAFIAEQPLMQSGFTTYGAVFSDVGLSDERAFEEALFGQLQALYELDRSYHRWDPTVSVDPASPHFSYSFGGSAFFVVGMHRGSSRLARRTPWPVLVFNPHAQFDELRARGIFDHFVRTVRARDEALQGAPNPNLAAFGTTPEARQYSGRQAEPGWKCPFHA